MLLLLVFIILLLSLVLLHSLIMMIITMLITNVLYVKTSINGTDVIITSITYDMYDDILLMISFSLSSVVLSLVRLLQF